MGNCDKNTCSCRKNGLICTLACGCCKGLTCSNAGNINDPEEVWYVHFISVMYISFLCYVFCHSYVFYGLVAIEIVLNSMYVDKSKSCVSSWWYACCAQLDFFVSGIASSKYLYVKNYAVGV